MTKEKPIKDYLQRLIDEGKRSTMKEAITFLARSCGWSYLYTKHLTYGIIDINQVAVNKIIGATDGALGYKELIPKLYWKIVGETGVV